MLAYLILLLLTWFPFGVANARVDTRAASVHQYYLCDLFVSTRLDEGFATAPELISTFLELPEVLTPTQSGQTNWTRAYPENIALDVIQEVSQLQKGWNEFKDLTVSSDFIRHIPRKMGGAEAYKSLFRDARRVLIAGAKQAKASWLSDVTEILYRIQLDPKSLSMGDILTIAWLNAAIRDPIRVLALVDDLTAQYYKEYNRGGHSPSGVTEYLLRIGREQLEALRDRVDQLRFVVLIPKLTMPYLRAENFSIGLPVAWMSLERPVEEFYEAIENAAAVAASMSELKNWSVREIFENYLSIQDAYSHALYLADERHKQTNDTRIERVIDFLLNRFLYRGLYTRGEMLADLQEQLDSHGRPNGKVFLQLYYGLRDQMIAEDGFRGGRNEPKLRAHELGQALGYISFALKSDKNRAEFERTRRLKKRPG